MEKIISNTLKNLERNGFKAEYFETKDEVIEKIIKEISSDETVAIGGSMTILDLGFYDKLKEKGNEVLWHWKSTSKDTLKKAMFTDVYLASTNALTEDGKLVSMDGVGNRVTSMIFGHERVYIIAGKNKICKNYEEASERIKNIAAPKNAKRLDVNTPCVHTGRCNDCDSPDRICNAEVILHKNPDNTQIIVYIINEDLGY